MEKTQKFTPKIPVIINCDTGIDDAVAIMMAVKSQKLDIKLITTDVGNTDTVQSAINSLHILDLVGAEQIAVCAGDGKCLEKNRPRPSVHGNTGLGEFEYENIRRRLLLVDAVDAIYDALKNSEEKVTIICMSPSTNIAKLLKKYADAGKYIERIVYMAGTIDETDKSQMPYPEFNVACDPEAGEVVINSGVPIEIVPMEMGHNAYLTWQEVFKTKITNNVGRVMEIMFRSYKDRHVKNGIAMHDGCAIAYVTNPELFEIRPVHLSVKYFDAIKTGVLTMNFGKAPNAITCVDMDIKRFKKLYFKCLKKCKTNR